MGRLFTPKVDFEAKEFSAKFQTLTSERTLIEAIRDKYPLYADNIAERFCISTGLELTWENISLPNLDRMVQYMEACELSNNSIRQYGAKLLAVLNLYRELHKIPSSRELSSVLMVQKDESYDAFLDDDDIDKLYSHLEKLKSADKPNRRYINILTHFLIGADTGARSYDERNITWDNVRRSRDSESNWIYVLTYTSQKRGIKASVPLSLDSRVIPLIKEKTELIETQRDCNRYIKKICRDAGLTRKVKRRRAGKDMVQELCEAIHFHVGRKSFCTNALKRGSSLTDVMQFMGHSNPKQTMGYNCAGPTFEARAIRKQRKAANAESQATVNI